jgi:AraC family transcriptional regulator, activator of mtrCDE
MDILSDFLETLRLHGGQGYNVVLSAPWGIEFPAREEASPFYVVSRGGCFLELVGTGARVYVNAGDLVMLPQGDRHILRDGPDSAVVPFSSIALAGDGRMLRFGNNGAETMLLAGEFVFGSPFARPALKAMERVVHIKADNDEGAGTFSLILKMLCREKRSTEPGSRAAGSELMKLLFIQILRTSMTEHQRQQKACPRHPLALMFHKELHGVTEALHGNPQRPWTVADMAAQAGMSRTKFSLRFSQVAGMAPLAYLTSHRMMKAAELLEHTDATLEEIAERVGYGSEAALSTAFKREMGMAPGSYRRSRNAPVASSSLF